MGGEALWDAPWPVADPAMLASETVVYAVQVAASCGARWRCRWRATQDEVLEAAKAVPNVAAHLEGKALVKEIVVPGRLVNLVTRDA